MKHAGQQSLTAGLAREIAFRIRHLPEMADLDVLVPVPMHWQRRILRGIGTSQMLAEAVSSDLGLPVSQKAIFCTRKTKKQSTLSPTARRRNMKKAFEAGVDDVSGLHVGLIDDTLTTGATANEAAKVLRKAGAREVSLIAVARAAGNNS